MTFRFGVAEFAAAYAAARPDPSLNGLTDEEAAAEGHRTADELDELAASNTDPYGRALMREQAAALRAGADAVSGGRR